MKKKQEINREILKILSDLNEKYPELRFNQLLFNAGVSQSEELKYYTESCETLKNMKRFGLE